MSALSLISHQWIRNAHRLSSTSSSVCRSESHHPTDIQELLCATISCISNTKMPWTVASFPGMPSFHGFSEPIEMGWKTDSVYRDAANGSGATCYLPDLLSRALVI